MKDKKFVAFEQSKQQKIIEMYLYAGLDFDYTLSTLKNTRQISKSTIEKLSAVADAGDERAQRLLDPLLLIARNRRIGGKPILLLRTMIENDLRLVDACRKIHVSVDTGNKHMIRLKQYFQCSTMAVLALRAMKQGWLGEPKAE